MKFSITMEMLSEAHERIKRLEHSLRTNHLPTSDYECECCTEKFVPPDWESVRCVECALGCSLPKGSKDWTQGDKCPAKKNKK